MVGSKVLVAHDSQRYIISSENQSNEGIPGIRSITENGTMDPPLRKVWPASVKANRKSGPLPRARIGPHQTKAHSIVIFWIEFLTNSSQNLEIDPLPPSRGLFSIFIMFFGFRIASPVELKVTGGMASLAVYAPTKNIYAISAVAPGHR
jgi:hypothetical protein